MAGRSNTAIALLRGINVGGKHKLPMKELAAIFETAGARDVRTYIQSGNVVYAVAASKGKGLAARVEAAIEEAFGFEAPVVTRTAAELEAIVEANPFVAEGADESKLHVGFLADRPKAAARAALDPDRSPPDRFELVRRELYLHCPNGVARTKLTNAWFDRTLDTITTVRNWKTTLRLLAMTRD